MAQGKLDKRLSAQDASFLYFERDEAPMHIGSIAVLEGDVSYERFVDNIVSKLHLIPRYMQRVVAPPFNIGHPTWEWDPDFDIKNHVKLVEMEAPGTDAQLMELAAGLFFPKLDRRRPLWEINLVKGLEGGHSALVSKVHHCLVDDVSGIDLLMVVMDVQPDPLPPVPPAEPLEKTPIPDPLTQIFEAVMDNLSASVDRWAQVQNRIADSLLAGDTRARAMANAAETALPYVMSPVERAPFNKPFGGGRKVACSEISFQEVRAIRGACGGTVNDVVLTVLGGAVGRYLEMHGQKTQGRSIRVLTPVNVRKEDERGALGNRVSMLLVEVPVGVDDPVERLGIVSKRTEALKRRRVADGIELLGDGMNGVPPMVQAMMGVLPQPPNTLANMVCTNVPGPMIPLYSVGHRLLAHYPLIPIGWEMGISCGVTSYDQKLYFGLMADAEAGSDVGRMKEFLDQAYVELRSAAGVSKSDIPTMGLSQVAAEQRRASASAGQALAADAG